jgi:hypothetical protein
VLLIFIHPGSSNSNKRGEKKICCLTFLVATNHTIENNAIFEQVQKIFFCQLTKNYHTFCPKTYYEALKNMGWGSGIRKKNLSRITWSRKHRILVSGSGSASLVMIHSVSVGITWRVHRKKNFSIFPSSDGMLLTKLSPGRE